MFYNPGKVIFGQGKISTIGVELKNARKTKVLLVAGGGSIKHNGVYQQVRTSFIENGIEWVESWGVQPNPTLSKVKQIITFAKMEEVTAIVAVGGGSVIDTCKAVATGMKFSGDVWDLFIKPIEITEAIPIYSVLTLSATGSEVNGNAVISNEPMQEKRAISSPTLIPVVAIMDPSVQAKLPWFQTVNGAVDAISHIMEQYFSGEQADTTMGIAESLIKSIIKATDTLQENPEDYDARANLAWAASLALNTILMTGTGSGDWASHGIEHGISAVKTDVAHGAGLAVVFPAWIQHVGSEEIIAFERWMKNVWNCNSLKEAIEAYKNKLKAWGHPTTLRELGVEEGQDIEDIVKSIMKSPVGRVKKLTEDDIRRILLIAN